MDDDGKALSDTIGASPMAGSDGSAGMGNDGDDASARDDLGRIGAALPPLIVYVDQQRRLRFVSAAFEALFGRSRSDILGQPLTEILDPAIRDRTTSLLDQALAGEAGSTEVAFTTSEGEARRLTIALVPDATPTGEIVGAYGSIWDLTAARQVEADLEESEARCRLALDAGGMGLWMLDSASGSARWDARQSQLLGDVPSARSRTVDEFFARVHPDDIDALKQMLAAPGQERSDFTHEFRTRLPDGSVRWLASRGVIAPDGQGGRKVTAVSYDITERKQAEGTRREREERFRFALDAGRMGIWDWDLQTNLVRVEGQDAATWGWSSDVMEVPLDRLFDRVHPDDVPRVRDAIDRDDVFDGMVATEFRVRQPNGDTRWLLARGRVQRDEAGSAVSMAGAHIDVTDRRRIEEALRQSKEHYRKTFDNMAVGMAHIGSDGRWLRVNSRLCSLLGYAHDEMLRRSLIDVTHPDDRALCRSGLLSWNEACGDPRPRQADVRFVHQSGRIVRVSVTLAVAGESSGPDPSYGIAVIQDVTERRDAEQALRRSEGEKRLALEAASLGTFRLDLAGRHAEFDDRCCSIFGFASGDSIVADALGDRVHPDERERFEHVLKTAAEQAGEFDLETRIQMPDHGVRWVMIRGQVARHHDRDDTDCAQLVGVVLDITERRRDQELREGLVAELSHRVKNTLATVQSIAARTLVSSADPVAFRTAFEGRIRALAHSHALLADSRWAGASLVRIVRAEMTPYDDWRGQRLTIEGPDLMLKPRAALSLGIIVHELATNAAKYGALRVPSGQVSVRWRIAEDERPRLVLTWRESGGPPVAEPERIGFGRVMIERGLTHELRGQASMRFEPGGLHCILTIPLAEIVAET